jgi:hypothetical protein
MQSERESERASKKGYIEVGIYVFNFRQFLVHDGLQKIFVCFIVYCFSGLVTCVVSEKEEKAERKKERRKRGEKERRKRKRG